MFGDKSEKKIRPVREQEDSEAGSTPRWIPATVVGVAMVSFVGLAWYAYHAGSRSVHDEDLVLIEADKSPVKDKPEDPGGMKFPHQDKTIFDAISANPNAAQGERVLPAPEEPMTADAVQAASQDTKTWVNDKLKAGDQAGAAPVEQPELQAAVPLAPEMAAPVQPVLPSAPAPVADAAPLAAATPAAGNVAVIAPVAPAPAAKTESLPLQDAKPTEAVHPETKPVEIVKPAQKAAAIAATDEAMKKTVANTAAKKAPAAAPAAKAKPAASGGSLSGGSLVQLGAYKSEAEAKTAWGSMEKKFTQLASYTPQIVKADLGTKGVFFRLRVSTPNAKELCSQLAAHKQACMPVK